MDIKNLQRRLRDFAVARDWQSSHTPKNLAMALMVEAAELLELFQWLTTAQFHTLTKTEADKERVSDEIADVLVYLLQLADHTGVDVEQAVERKLRKNAEKHPAKHPEPAPLEPPAPVVAPPAPSEPFHSRVHLLVDWENVQPRGSELHALVPNSSDVWLFHGMRQSYLPAWHADAFGERVTPVPIARPGKNALDFHLAFYMGYIAAKQPMARFVVISNDKGYDPMLEHARDLGFLALRRDFSREPPAPAAKPVVAKKVVPAKKTAPAKKVAPPKTDPPAKVLPTPKKAAKATPAPTASQVVQRVLASLKKMPDNKPTGRAGLLKHIETHAAKAADPKALAQQVCALLEARKDVVSSPDGKRISYPKLSTKTLPSLDG